MSGPARCCGMTVCASAERVRLYPNGWRCWRCTPARQAGVPEPDELLARHRAALARVAAGTRNPPESDETSRDDTTTERRAA